LFHFCCNRELTREKLYVWCTREIERESEREKERERDRQRETERDMKEQHNTHTNNTRASKKREVRKQSV